MNLDICDFDNLKENDELRKTFLRTLEYIGPDENIRVDTVASCIKKHDEKIDDSSALAEAKRLILLANTGETQSKFLAYKDVINDLFESYCNQEEDKCH